MEEEIVRVVRRGFDDEDIKWFSQKAVDVLKKAQEEIQWLMDRGYKQASIIDLVGGHYQLSSRQRSALQRATSSTSHCEERKKKQLSMDKLKQGCIYIDGFNLIITLEVALSNGTIVLCNDGTIRDIAGLRGTYSLIDKTDKALILLGSLFKDYEVSEVKFYLDAPVSNSGRLKRKILEYAQQWGITAAVELVPNADPLLSKMDRIITTDSIILDNCISWFNVARHIIENYAIGVKIIEL
jgi:hypothetical protein